MSTRRTEVEQLDMPSQRDLVDELTADIEQIEDNASLFRAGRNSAYQAVAIQLRNLVLNGRQGLMERVFPGLTLHPLKNHGPAREEQSDGTIRVTIFGNAEISLGPPGKSSLQFPVDRTADPIPLQEWLGQWVIDPQTRIDQLINETANEEVAHTQEERGKTLAHLSPAGVYDNISHPDEAAGRRPDRHMHQMMIVAIGEYVAERARELLEQPAK